MSTETQAVKASVQDKHLGSWAEPPQQAVRTAQRGFSKRYSRSGARSLCSLFLFLAKSLSSAMTSFSNISGAGFASAREEWAERIMSASQYLGKRILKRETLALPESLGRRPDCPHSSSKYTQQPALRPALLEQPLLRVYTVVHGCCRATMAE